MQLESLPQAVFAAALTTGARLAVILGGSVAGTGTGGGPTVGRAIFGRAIIRFGAHAPSSHLVVRSGARTLVLPINNPAPAHYLLWLTDPETKLYLLPRTCACHPQHGRGMAWSAVDDRRRDGHDTRRHVTDDVTSARVGGHSFPEKILQGARQVCARNFWIVG